MPEPRTCDICGSLITQSRGGELIRRSSDGQLVWVHPDCRGREPVVYLPQADARFAYLSLDDPVEDDLDGWIELRLIEAQRGRWPGSDGANFRAGLDELVAEGWAEANRDETAWRLTGKGSSLKPRLEL